MKVRLDQLLVERGLTETRTKAAAIIMSGSVQDDHGRVLDKPGQAVAEDIQLVVKQLPRYVSRGGDKLESVAGQLGVDLEGKVVLDVGASTGGFSDYALQHGAAKVYAVDVGHAQLAHKLRQDPRVVAMEHTDIRELQQLPELADLALIDVSFISAEQVLERVSRLVKPDAQIVLMAKPQFEAGKEVADKFKGVISDAKVRAEILAELEGWLNNHFAVLAAADSGLAGAKGNVERFYLLKPKR